MVVVLFVFKRKKRRVVERKEMRGKGTSKGLTWLYLAT